MAPERCRLFIASLLKAEAYQALWRTYQRNHHLPVWENYRWVPPAQWHLTWCFLGDVDTGCVQELQRVLSQVFCVQHRLTLHLEQVAWWPRADKPQTLVWQGNGGPELTDLAQRLRLNMTPFIQKPDTKRFKPHVTIARVRRGREDSQVRSLELPPVSWTIQDISLYQSILTSAGAIHTELASWAFVSEPPCA